MLTINSAYKRFGMTTVLRDISTSIAHNTIVGLAGPSGGGKSTLLRCIQGLDKLDSGSIICEAKTGFMFQDFQLFPHMTVLQNLIYAPMLHDKNTDYSAQAVKLLEDLGIVEKMHIYPNRLSGGQKQRVALARSLMMSPQLLLCDEPTSGLDVATVLDVVTLLRSVREREVTMIIASHDLDFLTRIADRIIVLKCGSIIVDIEPRKLQDPIISLKAIINR